MGVVVLLMGGGVRAVKVRSQALCYLTKKKDFRVPGLLVKITPPPPGGGAEKESGLIEMLSFLALGRRWPWGVPAQDRGK